MNRDFTEQAHSALCMLIGQAAYQLLAEGQAITNRSLAEMIEVLAVEEPDLAKDFALQLLMRKRKEG